GAPQSRRLLRRRQKRLLGVSQRHGGVSSRHEGPQRPDRPRGKRDRLRIPGPCRTSGRVRQGKRRRPGSGRRYAESLGRGHDQAGRLWDAVSGAERGTWRDFASPVVSLAFAPDGNTLAAGTGHTNGTGTLSLREVATGRERFAFKGNHWTVRSLCFTPDGK